METAYLPEFNPSHARQFLAAAIATAVIGVLFVYWYVETPWQYLLAIFLYMLLFGVFTRLLVMRQGVLDARLKKIESQGLSHDPDETLAACRSMDLATATSRRSRYIITGGIVFVFVSGYLAAQ